MKTSQSGKKVKLDKVISLGAIISLLVLSLPIILAPEKSTIIINLINEAILTKFGSFYIWFGLFCLIFCVWISFSRYGKVLLGDEGEKQEFSNFSWAGMLFSAGVGSGVVYWGIVEWVYYFKTPPLGAEAGTWQAAELAASYGLFHWGPMAWAMYAVTSCSVAYIYFVRKRPIMKLSEACRGLLGNRVDGFVGKLIDLAFIGGLIGGSSTSLGLGTPLITAGISRVFGVGDTPGLQMGVLFIITCVFAFSAYSGLKKGIKVLSDINVVLAFVITAFVLIVGNTVFIIEMGTTAIGCMFKNFIQSSTWMDPAGKSMFPQYWTVFYWAWWAAAAPFIGMFIARISKGRTIKQMVLGCMLYGSAGCGLFFVVLGNYGLDLQLTGKMDVAAKLSELGGPQTIIAILDSLPMGKLIILLVAVLCSIFIASSFDSISFIFAANCQKNLKVGEEPARWLRLVCAFGIASAPFGFFFLGSPLKTLQTISLVFAFPVSIATVMAAFSFVRMVKTDIREKKLTQKAVLAEFSDVLEVDNSK